MAGESGCIIVAIIKNKAFHNKPTLAMPVCGAVVALAVCKLGRPQIVLNCLGKINARGIERGCSLGRNKD